MMKFLLVAIVFSLCHDAVAATTMLAMGMSGPTWDQTKVKMEQLTVDVPTPRDNEVLIEVAATSVNHLDLLWNVIHPSLVWDAFLTAWAAEGGFPKVQGLDVAGKVVGIGASVSRAKIGDKVWAFNAKDCVFDGKMLGGVSGHTWAQYVAVPEDVVGQMPSNLNFTEAASLPLVALTVLKELKNAGAPWKGNSTVVILGSTGGTGQVAVQLAKILGASYVIATASGVNRDYVLSLGADEVLDYHTQNWAEVVPAGSVTAVVDTVMRPGTGDVAYAKLRPGGRYAGLCTGIPSCGVPAPSFRSILEHPTNHYSELRCTAGFPGYCASGAGLDEIREYVEAGLLKPRVSKIYPLSRVQDGIDELLRGHTIGKIAITVKEDEHALVV